MKLLLKDEKYSFTVTKAAEPKTEFGSGKQKMNRASQLPEWVVEVLAMDSERGEVIRRYSTTMRTLRAARRNWQRRQRPSSQRDGDKTIITLTDLHWAGRGWRTTGDAFLALSAATRAREHRRVAREEMAAA